MLRNYLAKLEKLLELFHKNSLFNRNCKRICQELQRNWKFKVFENISKFSEKRFKRYSESSGERLSNNFQEKKEKVQILKGKVKVRKVIVSFKLSVTNFKATNTNNFLTTLYSLYRVCKIVLCVFHILSVYTWHFMRTTMVLTQERPRRTKCILHYLLPLICSFIHVIKWIYRKFDSLKYDISSLGLLIYGKGVR